MTWFQAFALTQLIEMPIYLVGMRGAALSVPMRVAVAFGASALTHPIVWFPLRDGLVPLLGGWGYFVVAEAFAILAEWAYLRSFGLANPLQWSLLANGTSLTIGLVIYAFL